MDSAAVMIRVLDGCQPNFIPPGILAMRGYVQNISRSMCFSDLLRL